MRQKKNVILWFPGTICTICGGANEVLNNWRPCHVRTADAFNQGNTLNTISSQNWSNRSVFEVFNKKVSMQMPNPTTRLEREVGGTPPVPCSVYSSSRKLTHRAQPGCLCSDSTAPLPGSEYSTAHVLLLKGRKTSLCSSTGFLEGTQVPKTQLSLRSGSRQTPGGTGGA